jgi:hypothetical protein
MGERRIPIVAFAIRTVARRASHAPFRVPRSASPVPRPPFRVPRSQGVALGYHPSPFQGFFVAGTFFER